jgi:hypothetical protein
MMVSGDIEIVVPWRLSWARPVTREHWYHIYRREVRGIVYECPCCHYPTLKMREGNSNCRLCWWTDHGQDERNADQMWVGANGRYSLTEARENWQRHLLFLRPEDPAYPLLQRSPETKRQICACFDAMLLTTDPDEIDRLWRRVLHLADDVQPLGQHYQRLLHPNWELYV